MNHWLGIETYERCAMDTEFAQQTVDESSELGLERGIAMKYTNLGRYDQDLVMWKREHKDLVKGGYGYIPSKILHPYGAKDVCTPYRAYPLIKRQLEAQRLWEYYKTIFNPFVTDVFTEFSMTGLPMDVPMMDDLRKLFTWTTERLNKKLQERIATEAMDKLKSRVLQEFGVKALMSLAVPIKTRDEEGLKTAIKLLLSERDRMKDVVTWNSMIHHMVEAPRFNIRSPDQMARWLFDFEGLTPIKSTNQKAKGLPSMSWEKVLELPKDRQALYKPAVDKPTGKLIARDRLGIAPNIFHCTWSSPSLATVNGHTFASRKDVVYHLAKHIREAHVASRKPNGENCETGSAQWRPVHDPRPQSPRSRTPPHGVGAGG